MRRFATGPIDEDQHLGDIHNLHVEAENTTGEPITVTVRFFALHANQKEMLNEQTKTVDVHAYFNESSRGREHLAVEVEHNGEGETDVLFTVQGRDKRYQGLPSATYRHADLVELTPVVMTFGGFNQLIAGTEGLVFVRARVRENVVEATVPLRYRATLTQSNGHPVVGLSVRFPDVGDNPADPSTWSTVTTDANGQILFGPASGFTLNDLPALLSPLGVTTPFITALAAGGYVLKVELLNIANPPNPVPIGEGEVHFAVS